MPTTLVELAISAPCELPEALKAAVIKSIPMLHSRELLQLLNRQDFPQEIVDRIAEDATNPDVKSSYARTGSTAVRTALLADDRTSAKHVAAFIEQITDFHEFKNLSKRTDLDTVIVEAVWRRLHEVGEAALAPSMYLTRGQIATDGDLFLALAEKQDLQDDELLVKALVMSRNHDMNFCKRVGACRPDLIMYMPNGDDVMLSAIHLWARHNSPSNYGRLGSLLNQGFSELWWKLNWDAVPECSKASPVFSEWLFHDAGKDLSEMDWTVLLGLEEEFEGTIEELFETVRACNA